MEFNRTQNIKTESQLNSLIAEQKAFYLNDAGGKPAPFSNEYNHLLYRNDNGGISVKQHTWNPKTAEDIAKEEAEAERLLKVQEDADALIVAYKADTERWRTEVVKPWSMSKFTEWIDDTHIKPFKYNLTVAQKLERETKHAEILTYHNQTTYKTEAQLDSAKPSAPSWV